MNVFSRDSLFRRALAGTLLCAFAANTLANPTGMTVAGGSATATTSGPRLTITTSQSAFLNWQSFNIAGGETTIFNQPSVNSVVVNRINDQNPSQIFGGLQANGMVVLLNSSGFYFGPNSFVKTAGLVVSTANCIPPQNGGGAWEFNGPPPLASIVNYGQIKVGNGGAAYLIADKIENHGDIEAPGGSIGLAAGQTVLLSERPDGRGMSMTVTLPRGSVDNDGKLIADGGTIAMHAQVVNQNGLVQANSVRQHNGAIELVASDRLNLGADSQILAHGDDSAPGSSGGSVTLKSDNEFSDSAGSRIVTAGGAWGGNGGNVEVSAPNVESLNSGMDASAKSGWSGGTFFLDPVNIVLGASGTGAPDGSGTVAWNSGSGTLNINVGSAFLNKNFSQILLQASGKITLNTLWNLTASTGRGDGYLIMEAGGDIVLNSGSKITDANNWAVTLEAGYDFTSHSVSAASGSITLSGNSSIQTAVGDISLTAGQNITVNSGFVRTTKGGNVSAWALAGSVNTGNYNHGYSFAPEIFSPDGSLPAAYCVIDTSYGVGGISTEAGGNVKITAGKDVTSYLPGSSDTGDAGTGAFGPKAGNVTIVAGGNVTGHYVVANGTGAIYAGVKMVNGIPVDADGNPVTDGKSYVLDPASTGSAGTEKHKLALSLIAGGWTVDAAQDIYLQEVRNPNGMFNYYTSFFDPNVGSVPSLAYHYFDYAPDAYVNLSAGNSVNLGDSSTSLPRISGDVHVPFLYPPILNIVAGKGGVVLNGDSDPSSPYAQLILFPSPQGSLTITTTDGGPLKSGLPNNSDGSPNIFNLIVSDSGQTQYNQDYADLFGLTDHAATPRHINSFTPIALDISGNMEDVLLSVPEAAQITVHGDMINSRFQGMNLSPDPSESVQVPVREIDGSMGWATVYPGVTSIKVTGDILNRSDFTTATLPPPPNLSLLGQVPLPNTLAGELTYDSKTGLYTFHGEVTGQALNDLANLTIQVYVNGQPQFDAQGNPITTQVNLLDPGVAPGTLGPNAQTLLAAYVSGAATTTVMLAPNLSVLDQALSASPLAGHLYYDNITGKLTLQGAVTDSELNALADLTIQEVDSQGNTILQHVNVLDPSVALGTLGPNAMALQAEYDLLGGVPTSLNSGYLLGGGGQFNVTARNIDLGTTLGILSQGVSFDTISTPDGTIYPLAKYFTRGADINVNVTGTGAGTGNLDMFSSSIASVNGGNISIIAGGNINAGSDVFTVTSDSVRGIFTTVQSDISVIANGDINVNGSRIATFDGGDVTVESLAGNINAGKGASSTVTVDGFYVDPYVDPLTLTRHIYHSAPRLPFSGIVALTFPERDSSYPAPAARLGNILVEAPQGDVVANVAGVLQIPLNYGSYPDAGVTVLAGYELRDGVGNPVTAGNMAQGTPVWVSADRTIDVRGSGVLASNAKLEASGSIIGLIFAFNNIDIIAQQNVNVTALGGQNVNVSSSGGTISGTLIGGTGVNASGTSVEASLISDNVTGATSGQTGLGQGTAANGTAQAASSDDSAKTAVAASQTEDDDTRKKKDREAVLVQKTGRVTVLLPPKNLSQNQTSSDHL